MFCCESVASKLWQRSSDSVIFLTSLSFTVRDCECSSEDSYGGTIRCLHSQWCTASVACTVHCPAQWDRCPGQSGRNGMPPLLWTGIPAAYTPPVDQGVHTCRLQLPPEWSPTTLLENISLSIKITPALFLEYVSDVSMKHVQVLWRGPNISPQYIPYGYKSYLPRIVQAVAPLSKFILQGSGSLVEGRCYHQHCDMYKIYRA